MTFRNRIVERKRMRIGDLAPHPFNPKMHPEKQHKTIRAILEKYGIVDGVIAYYSERNGGDLTLFDGHDRRNQDPDQIWDVVITDLTDEEADGLIMMFDPVAAMAETDRQTMATLLENVDVVDPVLTEMLAAEAEAVGLYFEDTESPPEDFLEYDEEIETEYCCPKCGYEWSGKPR